MDYLVRMSQTCVWLRFLARSLVFTILAVVQPPQELLASKPDGTYLFVGESLQLTCTLSAEVLKTYTAHNISFGFLDPRKVGNALRCVNMPCVDVLNLTTAMLTIHHVTREDAGQYTCYVGSSCYQTSGSSSGWEAVEYLEDISIEYPPQNVTNFQCVVYNWDESMTCSWQHPVNYTHTSQISVTSEYINTVNRPVRGYRCPQPSETGCVWKRLDFIPSENYVVIVAVRNTYKARSTVKQFDVHTSNIVKPAAIDVVNASVDGEIPGCIFLFWRHRRIHQDKVYRIKHQQVGDAIFVILADNITRINFTACGYKAYTYHTFSVECYPTSGSSGYWSDPVYTHAWTTTTAPEVGPPTTNGSFTSSECIDGLRNVTVMWQELEPSARNGILDSYVIQGRGTLTIAQANQTSAHIQLPCSVTTTLSIFAHNKEGNSLKPSVLLIPPVTVRVSPKIKESFAVELTSHQNSSWHTESLHASWAADDGRGHVNYTIFWCQGFPGQSCQGKLSWAQVSGDETDLEIPLSVSLSRKYMFGISVFNVPSEIASGIFWTECLFTRNPNNVSPVEGMQVYSGVENIWVTWDMFHCTYDSRTKVSSYRIKWCQVAHCSGIHGVSSVVVPATEFSYMVSPLVAKVEYLFTVQPVSYLASGPEINPWKSATPLARGYQSWLWSVFGLVVGAPLVIFIVWYLYRKCQRRGQIFKDLDNNLLNWDNESLLSSGVPYHHMSQAIPTRAASNNTLDTLWEGQSQASTSQEYSRQII